MFIDITYFKGAIEIPNIDLDPAAFQSNWIEPFEKEALIMLLGWDLYNQFKTGLEQATPAQNWKDLRDGKTYLVTVSGIDYNVRWNGLVNPEKISLLAYYVYYRWLEKNYQQLTGLGVVEVIQEKCNKYRPQQKAG